MLALPLFAANPSKKVAPKPAPEIEDDSPLIPDSPESAEALPRERGPGGCEWVEGSATAVISEKVSRVDAQEEARQLARVVAKVEAGLFHGRIVEEKALEEGYGEGPGDCRTCRFHSRIRTCILSTGPATGRGLRIELNLARRDFLKGEPLEFSFTSNRDGYFHIYRVSEAWEAEQLPRHTLPHEKRILAGETISFPQNYPVEIQGMSLILAESAPEVTKETLRIIFVDRLMDQNAMSPRSGGYLRILQRVETAGSVVGAEWAEVSRKFTVTSPKSP